MTRPVMLKVAHNGTPKYVGKVFQHHGGFVFFHKTVGGPSQWHRQLESPFPMDAVVVAYLQKQKVARVLCETQDGTLLETTVAAIVAAPVRNYGDRVRHYLPIDAWTLLPESMLPTPWIEAEKVL